MSGLLDMIKGGGRRGGAIPPNATFTITQQGTEKVEEFNGDDNQMILMSLTTGGTLTLREIAQRTRMPLGRAERVISKLAQGGYVRLATGGSMD